MTDDHMAGAGFAVNPQVLHESIDDEVIIIDLSTGSYYSLRGSAAEIWRLLARFSGATSAELVDALGTGDDGDQDIETVVSRFVGELCEEKLVSRVAAADGLRTAPLLPEGNGRSSFEPPIIEKYTDMQDLVLLDPVHDVDQTGWPRVPTDAAPDGASA
ncbi:MAG: PqqD family protein [Gemmatimonadaceae bacterium]|nr:PqqD family protein [Gemmatimonadaceae bacterium]